MIMNLPDTFNILAWEPTTNIEQFFAVLNKFCDTYKYFYTLYRDIQGVYEFTLGRNETMKDGGTYGVDVFEITALTLKELMPLVVEAICKEAMKK